MQNEYCLLCTNLKSFFVQTVVWKNITGHEFPPFPNVISIECIQYTNDGKIGYEKKIQILRKYKVTTICIHMYYIMIIR